MTSHHFPSQNIGVINTLIKRALRISDKDNINEELKHLAEVFIKMDTIKDFSTSWSRNKNGPIQGGNMI